MNWFHNLRIINKMHLTLNPIIAGLTLIGALFCYMLYQQQSEWFWLAVTCCTIIIVNTFFFGILLLKNVAGRARDMAKLLEQIDNSRDISYRFDKNKDEIGQIAEFLNQMLSTMGHNFKKMDEIGSALRKGADASLEVSSNGAELLELTRSESAQLATATEQMTATAQEIAHNTASTVESAAHAKEASARGSQVLSDSTVAVSSLSEQIAEVGEIVNRLAERSEEVTGVLDVIKSVAEQTNLLALNAAIEAARAGEQGRGFAVVADEVRTLAQRTQASAQDIDKIVCNFQEQTSQANNRVQDCVQSAERTVNEVTGLSSALNEIDDAISTISDMAMQIATAAEQQVATNEEINRSVNRVDGMTKSNSEKIRELAETAKENAYFANSLEQITEEYTY